MVISAVVWIVFKKPVVGILLGYVFLIIAVTLLVRGPFDGEHLKLELFWSWKAWSVQHNQVVANIVMFIPVGLLAGWLWRWLGLVFVIGLSCGIEVVQLITLRGLCEFDDVIHNMVGAAVGIGITMMVKMITARRESQ